MEVVSILEPKIIKIRLLENRDIILDSSLCSVRVNAQPVKWLVVTDTAEIKRFADHHPKYIYEKYQEEKGVLYGNYLHSYSLKLYPCNSKLYSRNSKLYSSNSKTYFY